MSYQFKLERKKVDFFLIQRKIQNFKRAFEYTFHVDNRFGFLYRIRGHSPNWKKYYYKMFKCKK